MNLTFQRAGLKLAHKWTIASRLGPGGSGGTVEFPVVLVRLFDPRTGITAFGEAAPSSRYGESVDSCAEAFAHFDPAGLDFSQLDASRELLKTLGPGREAARGALDMALLDGHGQWASKPVHSLFGLDFKNRAHLTSFSIGIDSPEVVAQKVREAREYPVLKLKVGSPNDASNLRALREVSPSVRVRLDANEAWKTPEEALHQLEQLATDPGIEFIEQPMPASTSRADWVWLKQRSPIPIMADESFVSAADAGVCGECFHAVNVKLVKTGGVTGAFEALSAARREGLKTMLGCMIETSVLISAAAHLAALTDWLDLDGNLLITNDPFEGVACDRGWLYWPESAPAGGLRVRPTSNPPA